VWAWVPVPTAEHINHTNWLPGFATWFLAGMILAELVTGPQGRMHRLASRRVLMGAVAAGAFGLAATPLAGPQTLTDLEPREYCIKVALGAVMSFALLAPLTLAPLRHHRILSSPLCLTVGRWSYGVFLWHLAVMSIVFPVFGLPLFSGHFVFVLVVTVVLSLAIA